MTDFEEHVRMTPDFFINNIKIITAVFPRLRGAAEK